MSNTHHAGPSFLTPCMSCSPAVQQSGRGGTFVLPTTNITEPGGEFGSIPVGAPYFGQDSENGDLCECTLPYVSLFYSQMS